MSAEQIDSDLQAVVTEARQWIQAVIGKELQGEFRESLEDGIVLCELMSKLKPGSIRKINAKNIAIAHLDNLKQFLTACESLGLKDSQLFNLTDLQAPGTLRMKTGGVKHTTADRRLRNVVITLYWLGRKMSQIPSYKGPQLDLEVFKEILDIPNQNYYLRGYETSQPTSNITPPKTKKMSPSPPPSNNVRQAKPLATKLPKENGMTHTTESHEKSADELLATIQSAVDELLYQCQEDTDNSNHGLTPDELPNGDENISFTARIVPKNGTLGLQIIGGADTALPAQIELLMPGGPAESSGLRPRDLIVSVDGQDICGCSHLQLINLIKQGSVRGHLMIGVVRRQDQALEEEEKAPFQRAESLILWEEENAERQRQQAEISKLYKKRELEQRQEEEKKMNSMEDELDIDESLEEMLDQQLHWETNKTLDDLQQQLAALNNLANRKPSPTNTALTNTSTFTTMVSTNLPVVPTNVVSTHVVPTSVVTTNVPVVPTTSVVPNVTRQFQVDYNREEEREDEDDFNEDDDMTPTGSDIEEFEPVRVDGEGMESEPVIVPISTVEQPPPINEDDLFAPLRRTTSPQPQLLQEVLSANATFTKEFNKQPINMSYKPVMSSYNRMPPPPQVTPPTIAATQSDKESSLKVHRFNTPNASVVNVQYDDEAEEIQGMKVKAVQRTRWTPEAKDKRKVLPERSSTFSTGSYNGYHNNEKHEVVMIEPRGRAITYNAPEPYHQQAQVNRPQSGQPMRGNSLNKPPNCSNCRRPILQGPMMAIPSRKLNFHSKCLMCVVCKNPITFGFGNTTVFLRHSLPHCVSCYSTDNGIRATTC